MGKRLVAILIILALSPISVSAQRSMRLDSLRYDVFRMLQMNTAGDSVTNVDRANVFINMANQQVCNDFPAIEKLDTITLNADSTALGVNSDFLNAQWVYLDSSNQWYPMQPVTRDEHATLYGVIGGRAGVEQDASDPGNLRRYWIHADQFFTYPKYKAGPVTKVIIAYNAEDANLSSNSSVSQVKSNYRKAILYFSCYLIKASEQMYDIAQFWLGMYEREKPRKDSLKPTIRPGRDEN